MDTDGHEVMCLPLQELKDLAAAQEERHDGGSLSRDGTRRSHVEQDHGRDVATVRARRMADRALRTANLYPLDEVLTLSADLYSDGLGERCAKETTRNGSSRPGKDSNAPWG